MAEEGGSTGSTIDDVGGELAHDNDGVGVAILPRVAIEEAGVEVLEADGEDVVACAHFVVQGDRKFFERESVGVGGLMQPRVCLLARVEVEGLLDASYAGLLTLVQVFEKELIVGVCQIGAINLHGVRVGGIDERQHFEGLVVEFEAPDGFPFSRSEGIDAFALEEEHEYGGVLFAALGGDSDVFVG